MIELRAVRDRADERRVGETMSAPQAPGEPKLAVAIAGLRRLPRQAPVLIRQRDLRPEPAPGRLVDRQRTHRLVDDRSSRIVARAAPFLTRLIHLLGHAYLTFLSSCAFSGRMPRPRRTAEKWPRLLPSL